MCFFLVPSCSSLWYLCPRTFSWTPYCCCPSSRCLPRFAPEQSARLVAGHDHYNPGHPPPTAALHPRCAAARVGGRGGGRTCPRADGLDERAGQAGPTGRPGCRTVGGDGGGTVGRHAGDGCGADRRRRAGGEGGVALEGAASSVRRVVCGGAEGRGAAGQGGRGGRRLERWSVSCDGAAAGAAVRCSRGRVVPGGAADARWRPPMGRVGWTGGGRVAGAAVGGLVDGDGATGPTPVERLSGGATVGEQDGAASPPRPQQEWTYSLRRGWDGGVEGERGQRGQGGGSIVDACGRLRW